MRDSPPPGNTFILTPPIAQWINSDGSKPATYVAYDIKYNKIFLSGDVDAYNLVFNYKPASVVVRFKSCFQQKHGF